MDWNGDAQQTVPSQAISFWVRVLHSAKKRDGKWWLTDFKEQPRGWLCKRNLVGNGAVTIKRKWHLRLVKPPGWGTAVWKGPSP